MSPRCIKQVDASQTSKYRPIRILPAMCRLFNRILADGINYFLFQNRLISAAQCGFVKWLSMDVQLLHCTNLPVKSIDNKRFVDTVYYIDFAKALIRYIMQSFYIIGFRNMV